MKDGKFCCLVSCSWFLIFDSFLALKSLRRLSPARLCYILFIYVDVSYEKLFALVILLFVFRHSRFHLFRFLSFLNFNIIILSFRIFDSEMSIFHFKKSSYTSTSPRNSMVADSQAIVLG
jgi:hypothetical protein